MTAGVRIKAGRPQDALQQKDLTRVADTPVEGIAEATQRCHLPLVTNPVHPTPAPVPATRARAVR